MRKKNRRAEPPSFRFKGVKLDNVRYEDVRDVVERSIGGCGYVCLTDVGNVVAAASDRALLTAINASLLSVCDGTPLAWFGHLIGCRRVQRISGCDLMTGLLRDGRAWRHYLLGDTEETIARVIARAQSENPGIEITGHSPPFRDFTEDDNAAMRRKIEADGADVVWVCFGGGKQEQWAHDQAPRLKRGILICVGAAFRYYAGMIRVPSRFVQRAGLQWLARTLQGEQPFRILKRRWRAQRRFLRDFPGEWIAGRRATRHDRQDHRPGA